MKRGRSKNFYGATNLFQFLHIKICLERSFSWAWDVRPFFRTSFWCFPCSLVPIDARSTRTLIAQRSTLYGLRIYTCRLCVFLHLSVALHFPHPHFTSILLIPANKLYKRKAFAGEKKGWKETQRKKEQTENHKMSRKRASFDNSHNDTFQRVEHFNVSYLTNFYVSIIENWTKIRFRMFAHQCVPPFIFAAFPPIKTYFSFSKIVFIMRDRISLGKKWERNLTSWATCHCRSLRWPPHAIKMNSACWEIQLNITKREGPLCWNIQWIAIYVSPLTVTVATKFNFPSLTMRAPCKAYDE